MKRILLTVLLAAVCGLVSAQDALFRKYSDTKGVQTVVISKAMMNLMANVQTDEMDISKIASKLDRLQILNCERPSLVPVIRKDAIEYFRKNKYEEIMNMKEDGESTVIYMKAHGKGKNEFVLFTYEKDEISIVNIIGNVTLNDIKKITNN